MFVKKGNFCVCQVVVTGISDLTRHLDVREDISFPGVRPISSAMVRFPFVYAKRNSMYDTCIQRI